MSLELVYHLVQRLGYENDSVFHPGSFHRVVRAEYVHPAARAAYADLFIRGELHFGVSVLQADAAFYERYLLEIVARVGIDIEFGAVNLDVHIGHIHGETFLRVLGNVKIALPEESYFTFADAEV